MNVLSNIPPESLPELAEKSNWGHSASQIGLDIAFREGIKQIIFAHHDPGAPTGQINALRHQTEEYFQWRTKQAETNRTQLVPVSWCFAHEGMEITL